MKGIKLSEQQLQSMYEQLIKLSAECLDTNWGNQHKESDIWKLYSVSTPSGRQFYESLSDEQLLKVIYDKAENLGRAPSQAEVFWVWREYIKLRFKKWPYALKAAKLPTSAGKGGKTLEQLEIEKQRIEVLLDKVRKKALSLGRIPHRRDLPEVCSEMKKYMDTWGDVITAAGLRQDFFSKTVHKIEDLEVEYINLLDELKNQAKALGRSPFHSEINKDIRSRLIARCGSWRNVLYQIGLEPVIRIKPFSASYLNEKKVLSKRHHRNSLYDCYFQVLNLDKQAQDDLEFVRRLSKKLGRTPDRKEVPAEIRRRLQEACGSWANALYQIGLHQ